MGMIQVPDDLQQAIEHYVRDGRAASAAEFLEQAVRCFIEDDASGWEEVADVVQAGIADIEAGRCTTIASDDDARRFHERMMARVGKSLAGNG